MILIKRKEDFDKLISEQQDLINLSCELVALLEAKVAVFAGEKIELVEIKIRLWYAKRKLEAEEITQAQLTEKRDIQAKYIEAMFNESQSKFAALIARSNILIKKYGKMLTDEVVNVICEIQRKYESKFSGADEHTAQREQKAFCYGQLKRLVDEIEDQFNPR